tara:strand:- start:29 stop:745 length:717 start_codon:yes stop_codon:yes gene_type:complete
MANADRYLALGQQHKLNSTVCLMLPDEEVEQRVVEIEEVSVSAIKEWEDKVNERMNISTAREIIVFPWAEHDVKSVYDFPQCNTFVTFETKLLKNGVLGQAGFDFSKSWFKYSWSQIATQHYKGDIKISIVLGGAAQVESVKELVDLPINDIRNIVLHEMGHALYGLGHYESGDMPSIGTKKSVMYFAVTPFTDQVLEVTDRDVDMIDRLYSDEYRFKPRACHFFGGELIPITCSINQ